MTIAAILSTVVAVFITHPITAYMNAVNRATLSDDADLSLRRMTRDIQKAVPNSVRVKVDPNNSKRVAVEFLNVVEGMRYRAAGPGNYLNFNQNTSQFDVIGNFQFATTNATCLAGSCRLVVYSTGENTGGAIPSDNPAPGANVYSTAAAPTCTNCSPPSGSVTITPTTTTVAVANGGSEGNLTLSAGALFAFPSPRQRLMVVDTPVSYICDSSTGVQSITRYANYVINPVQPTDPTVAPLNAGSSAQLTANVTNCSFNYAPGTATQNGIISMTITLSNGGESVTLLRQVDVDNSP